MRLRRTILAASLGCALVLASTTAVAAPPPQGSKIRYDLWFGDIHNHTRYSDGWEGSPADAFAHARASGADFLATSDHNFMLTQDEWSLTKDQAAAATDGSFAAMPASEYWVANGFGEVIVLNVDELRTKANFRGPGEKLSRHEVIAAFYDWLASHEGALGHWPHPGLYGDLDRLDHWTPLRDRAMVSIEIHNYGSWVGAPANWGVHDYESWYQLALDKGWHVMPSAVSDTHSPNWISGSPVRTVLLAKRLTPTDLYGAMRERRGYGTLDENLRISYELDGEVMGSIVTPETTYTAEIHVEDPDGVASDAITKIEIVSDHGQVAAAMSPPAGSTTVHWTPQLTSSTARYFYVRVTTASDVSGGEGVTAWTAPVWTGRPLS